MVFVAIASPRSPLNNRTAGLPGLRKDHRMVSKFVGPFDLKGKVELGGIVQQAIYRQDGRVDVLKMLTPEVALKPNSSRDSNREMDVPEESDRRYRIRRRQITFVNSSVARSIQAIVQCSSLDRGPGTILRGSDPDLPNQVCVTRRRMKPRPVAGYHWQSTLQCS